MNVLWIVVGTTIIGILAKRMALGHERPGRPDMGFVSQQWLAEHRLSQIADPQR
jgi:hypothetical protein